MALSSECRLCIWSFLTYYFKVAECDREISIRRAFTAAFDAMNRFLFEENKPAVEPEAFRIILLDFLGDWIILYENEAQMDFPGIYAYPLPNYWKPYAWFYFDTQTFLPHIEELRGALYNIPLDCLQMDIWINSGVILSNSEF